MDQSTREKLNEAWDKRSEMVRAGMERERANRGWVEALYENGNPGFQWNGEDECQLETGEVFK